MTVLESVWASATPMSSRSVVFLIPMGLDILHLKANFALLRILTAFSLQSFLIQIPSQSSLSWSRSSWSIVPVVFTIQLPPAWIKRQRSAPRTFQSHSEIRLLFLRTLMLSFIVVILEEHSRSMERRLTIAG